MKLIFTSFICVLLVAKVVSAVKCKCTAAKGKDGKTDYSKEVNCGENGKAISESNSGNDAKEGDCEYCTKWGVDDKPAGERKCVTKKDYKTLKESPKDEVEYEDDIDDLDTCIPDLNDNSRACYCNNEDYCNQSTSATVTSLMLPMGVLGALMMA